MQLESVSLGSQVRTLVVNGLDSRKFLKSLTLRNLMHANNRSLESTEMY